MNDFYNAEYLSERVAALAQERDDLKSKLKDREAFHESCQRVANKELQRWRTEVDVLREVIADIGQNGNTCKYCEHFNGKRCTHEGGEWCVFGGSFFEYKG
jgi:hypothetical protein